MFEKRLLERVRAGGLESKTAPEPSALLEDVLLHLRELLNVRQGSVPIRPDYGMPDMNDLIHVFPDAIDVLRQEIRRQIIEYEPRLRDVSVRHLSVADRFDSLAFAVSATLELNGRRERVMVETQVGDDGCVRLVS